MLGSFVHPLPLPQCYPCPFLCLFLRPVLSHGSCVPFNGTTFLSNELSNRSYRRNISLASLLMAVYQNWENGKRYLIKELKEIVMKIFTLCSCISVFMFYVMMQLWIFIRLRSCNFKFTEFSPVFAFFHPFKSPQVLRIFRFCLFMPTHFWLSKLQHLRQHGDKISYTEDQHQRWENFKY